MTLTATKQDIPPITLPGFEGINRYWDRTRGIYTAKILPGEFYVTRSSEVITTVLGSCVSACIRDKKTGVGGMNHFMLPVNQQDTGAGWGDTCADDSTRYGDFAMEHLINEILKHGGSKNRLEIKLFGGGQVLSGMTDVGEKNIHFVREFLHLEDLPIISEDLGGPYPRKVVYYSATGRSLVKKLHSQHNNTIVKRERKYLSELASEPVSGDVELF